MGKRTVEFTLGLIGGIIGFIAAIFALFFGAIFSQTIVTLGWLAILFATIGIVGAALVNSKTKIAGWLMLLSAVGGLISISFFYALSFVLLLVAGLMALIRKDETEKKSHRK